MVLSLSLSIYICIYVCIYLYIYNKCIIHITYHIYYISYNSICIYEFLLRLNVFKRRGEGFPGGAVVENLPVNAGDMGSSPGLGRFHMPRSN